MQENNAENERPQIAAAYDSWSQTYETMDNPTRDLAAAMLRDPGVVLVGRDVLEIGCGTGLNTRYLAEHARKVTAIDFSAGMLEKARANTGAANVKFQQGDIKNVWDVEDASVDVIVTTLVLEHIEDLAHVYKEAARVLRPGGEFLIFELHPYRQLRGGQAQFAAEDGTTIFVSAFVHSISEFVSAGIGTGFTLKELREEGNEEDLGVKDLPRILSLRFIKQ